MSAPARIHWHSPTGWGFYNPVELHVGRGCRQKLADRLSGQSLLIVSTQRGRRQLTEDRALGVLLTQNDVHWVDNVRENPGLSEQDIIDRYAAYQGLDLTLTDPLPASFDSTQHIDMWMLPLAHNRVLVGEYDAAQGGGVPRSVTEATVADLEGRGYEVFRTPGWQVGGSFGAHYTYTNAVLVNQVALICRFGGAYAVQDAAAAATFAEALPDHEIVQVDCSDIIGLSGAIHCIVMHVPLPPDVVPVGHALRGSSPRPRAIAPFPSCARCSAHSRTSHHGFTERTPLPRAGRRTDRLRPVTLPGDDPQPGSGATGPCPAASGESDATGESGADQRAAGG